MNIDKKELENIKDLEAEIIADLRAEISILADDDRNTINKIINTYNGKSLLYSSPEMLERMIDDLSKALENYIKINNVKGKLLSKKAIEKFISKQETIALTAKKLRLINALSVKKAAQRLKIATMELTKEKNILKSDISIFMENAKLAGFTEKEILSQLVLAGKDKSGLIQGFKTRVKSVTNMAGRREKAASKIDEFLKIASPQEDWQWITVSEKPCPDCELRAGKVMSYNRWLEMGIPGSGRTICGKFCRCNLIPYNISNELFPTVKVFDVDRKKLVLTTGSEERVLRAQKNQPKEN